MSSSAKHRGLGRGLDALIKGGSGQTAAAPASGAGRPAETSAAAETKGKVYRLPIGRIQKGPWQPRHHFSEEALEELTVSIREKGVLDPLWVRPAKDGTYELIAGERRLRAAQAAGLKEVPALLCDVTDLEAREMALIENLQRADLDPIEEAEGYRDLMREAGLTQEEVARRLGKARATVANSLRLLELSEPIRRAISAGSLSPGHAKVLLGVDEKHRERLAARVIAQELSVRALEKLIAGRGRARPTPPPTPPPSTPDTASHRQLKFLAERMQQELGTKVMLLPARVSPDGKREMGRMIIEFFDNDDLTRLLEMLNLGDLA